MTRRIQLTPASSQPRPLIQSFRLQPAGPGRPADAATTAPLAIAFGAYLPFGAPSPWAEVTPSSASTQTVTADQPDSDAVSRTVSVSDYGTQAVVLSGVPAGAVVEWSIVPDVASSGPKVLFQAAGTALIVWLTYDGGPHAAGTYTITATVDGESIGPAVLTLA